MPFIQCKGLEFFYERTNFTVPWKDQKDKALFLHGLHGSLKYWKHFQIGYFSKYFDVLNVDQRGHGKSYKPSSGYSIENMADDVFQITKTLSFTPFHLIGASMGGMVALQIALDHPDFVHRLVLVDSFPYSPDPLKGVIRSWIDQVKEIGYAKVMETFNDDNPSLFSKEYMQNRPNFIDSDNEDVLNNLMPAESFIGACQAILNFDIRNKLKMIRVPTLLITSNEGLGFETAKLIKREMPNAEIWAPEGYGHLINIEVPEIFNEKLYAFLTEKD